MINWELLIGLTIVCVLLAFVSDWIEVFMKGKDDDTTDI